MILYTNPFISTESHSSVSITGLNQGHVGGTGGRMNSVRDKRLLVATQGS